MLVSVYQMALDDEMEQLRAQIGHNLSVRSGISKSLCSELEHIKVQVTQVLTPHSDWLLLDAHGCSLACYVWHVTLWSLLSWWLFYLFVLIMVYVGYMKFFRDNKRNSYAFRQLKTLLVL